MLLSCGVGEDSWGFLGQQGDQISQSWRKSVLNNWKDWCWSWSSSILATWCKELTHWKDPDAGKDWRQKQKWATEDEMVGGLHQLNRHEFEKTLGNSEEWGSLVCCSPWGCIELDTTEQLNNNKGHLMEQMGCKDWVWTVVWCTWRTNISHGSWRSWKRIAGFCSLQVKEHRGCRKEQSCPLDQVTREVMPT